MARTTTRMGLGVFGILAGLGVPLAAQTLWVPASDPVGIARAGTGVAFGQSLEAASLNPALLVTLRDDASAFVAAGMEMQSSQATLQANSQVLFSTDRNRFLPSLGAAWKVRPDFFVGLKIDEPFMRHVTMPDFYNGRFEGQDLDLTTRRMEFQAAWSFSPNLSFGASLGVTRVQFSFENTVGIVVPDDPAKAADPTNNPGRGIMQVGVTQDGNKTLPSYTLGFRWAINPRWTLAGAYQGAIKGTLGLSARVDPDTMTVVDLNGHGQGQPSTATTAPIVLAETTAAPGSGAITLPGRLSLGLRQRLNQVFTWEADLHYVQGSSFNLPGYPTVTSPSGTVAGSGLPGSLHSGFGLSLMGEIALTKNLMGRLGVAQEGGMRNDPSVEPLLGGARSSSFAAGLGLRVFGGELNAGWMTRLSQDRDVSNLDGVWSQNGYYTTTTLTRVENMGHLWSLGFKKAF